MHYAVPAVLNNAGMLSRLYTDVWTPPALQKLIRALPSCVRPPLFERLAGRFSGALPSSAVTAFPGLGFQYALRLRRVHTRSDALRIHIGAGQAFCQAIRRSGFASARTLYTFNSAGLEAMQAARAEGLDCVMEQTIVPYFVERALLARERQLFPDWESGSISDPVHDEYAERERQEWALANIIVGGSDFVRDGIAECSGPADRCVVVPYGVDVPWSGLARTRQQGALRVLVAGAVSLRKGSQYVLKAARVMGSSCCFRLVGPVTVSKSAQAKLRACLELTGPVPRSRMAEYYAWANVFLLPSVCEGSATVTYEALGAGLPVITTRNAGSVVRNGVDGFVVPAGDPDAVVVRLEQLRADPNLLAEMSRNARSRASEFTVQKYGERLIRVLAGCSTTNPE